ncbi:hypothetical protein K2173_017456 [Erythroxylum novogranatense]|uniref:Uncharacterized protein n=1 Tax=Erythroxylum novogranatense TaxID=1862640 RepID=A0AAV8TKJ4_9ROSI|nr:hypothetical protein K2173_017456 [Erythroxylum novogranatense]
MDPGSKACQLASNKEPRSKGFSQLRLLKSMKGWNWVNNWALIGRTLSFLNGLKAISNISNKGKAAAINGLDASGRVVQQANIGEISFSVARVDEEDMDCGDLVDGEEEVADIPISRTHNKFMLPPTKPPDTNEKENWMEEDHGNQNLIE